MYGGVRGMPCTPTPLCGVCVCVCVCLFLIPVQPSVLLSIATRNYKHNNNYIINTNNNNMLARSSLGPNTINQQHGGTVLFGPHPIVLCFVPPFSPLVLCSVCVCVCVRLCEIMCLLSYSFPPFAPCRSFSPL